MKIELGLKLQQPHKRTEKRDSAVEVARNVDEFLATLDDLLAPKENQKKG